MSYANNKIKVWSLPVRLMHWTLVAAFCTAWVYRESVMDAVYHLYAGYVAAAVLVLRWIYGAMVRDYAGFRSFQPNALAAQGYLLDLLHGKAKRYLGHNPAGALAIYAMLVFGILTTATGYMSFHDMSLFDIIEEETIDDWHHYFAYAWLSMIGVHITGVIVGSISHRENLVLSMITGYKQRKLKISDRQTPSNEIPEGGSPALAWDSKWDSQLALTCPDDVTSSTITDTMRLRYIQEAAFYLAQRRGFTGGSAQEDWQEAEKQVDAMLAKNAKNEGASAGGSEY